MHGCVLHDSHAEVLARRGLVRVLWMEIMSSKKTPRPNSPSNDQHCLLEASPNKQGKFQLRSDTQLHLYISCSPCGDAAIYPVTNDQVMLHSGAKVIVSKESGVDATVCGGEDCLLDGTNVAREKVQLVGKLRTKSGRSNLPPHLRSNSMSCSDKIVKWCVLGLQGGNLSALMDPPILITTIIVSKDKRISENSVAQQEALQRAIPDRVKRVWEGISPTDVSPQWHVLIPSVVVVKEGFASDKAAMESRVQAEGFRSDKDGYKSKSPVVASSPESSPDRKRKRNKTTPLSPCGISLNWQYCDPDKTELVVGTRGICQGKKPKSARDYVKLASRLSRLDLLRLAQKYYNLQTPSNTTTCDNNASPTPRTYQEFKRAVSCPDWCERKTKILTSGILAGWLRSGKEGDFPMSNQSIKV